MSLAEPGPLPIGWRWVPIGELGKWSGGGTPSKAERRFWADGTIPWVSPKDVKRDRIVDSEDHITPRALKESPASLIGPGSVLIVTRSGILARTLPVAVTERPVTINQDIKALTPAKGINASYAAFALRAFEGAILRQCAKSGTTVASIEFSRLRAFSIPLASEDEQARIVAEIEKHFTRLDAGVAALKRLHAHLRRFRAAVLKAACEGRLLPGHPGNKRESGQDSLMPQIPSTWRWTSLGSLLTAIQGGKNFRCEERPPERGEFGVVKVSAVTWGTFNADESKTSSDPNRYDDESLIREGDFLFSRANTIELVGACVIAGPVRRTLMLSDKILRFTLSGVDPLWVLWVLRSPWGRHEIERLATGNQESMRNIGQDRIRQIRLPLPPPEEQRLLVQAVERSLSLADGLLRTAGAGLHRAARLRASILRRGFSGELVSSLPSSDALREAAP